MIAVLYPIANAANAWAILAILTGAFVFQFLTGEPPCPLCLMQRIAMMLAILGPCHVLVAARRGPLAARDVAIGCGMLILASVAGATISVRQILLHILPNDTGYGSPLFGYHLYTWAFFVFAANILAAGLQLVGLRWFEPQATRAPDLARPTLIAATVMVAANLLSAIAEAGFAWNLPENPVGYLLFH